MEIFIFFLVIVAIIIAFITIPYFAKKGFLDWLRSIGEEQFEITTDKDSGVVSKNHSKKYPLGIALQAGRHYRFGFKKSEVVDHYMCFLPGYAYIGELLPEFDRMRQPEIWYFHIKIPNNLLEAQKIIADINSKLCYWYQTNNLSADTEIGSFFNEEQTERLVRPGFDFTERMTSLQKWCWENAKVYIFQDMYFRIEPKAKKISFLKITPSDDGRELKFEERSEESINFIANYFPYGKRISDQEDATNIPLGVDFGIEGRVENPWMADNLFSDVFTQNDINVRGEGGKVINQFSFLNKPASIGKTSTEMESFEKTLQTSHSLPPNESEEQIQTPQHIATEEEESAERRKNRLALAFEPAILASLHKLENYTGFVWKSNVQVFNIYPSGPGAQKILDAQIEGAVQQQKSVGEFMRVRVEIVKRNAEIYLRNIEDKNQNERDYEKKLNDNKAAQDLRLKVAEAEAKAIELATKPLVAALGREGAISVLNNKSLMEALAKTGSNVFFNASTGNDGTSTNEKLITQFLAKNLADDGKQVKLENEKQVSPTPESEGHKENSDTSTSSSPKDADTENPDGPEKK